MQSRIFEAKLGRSLARHDRAQRYHGHDGACFIGNLDAAPIDRPTISDLRCKQFSSSAIRFRNRAGEIQKKSAIWILDKFVALSDVEEKSFNGPTFLAVSLVLHRA